MIMIRIQSLDDVWISPRYRPKEKGRAPIYNLQRRLDEGSFRPIGSEGLPIPLKAPEAPTYLQDHLTRLYPELFGS
jgi:hypothetical protein